MSISATRAHNQQAHREAANLTDKQAADEIRDRISSWGPISTDDIRKMQYIADMIENGEKDYAMSYVTDCFDTFLREEIPARVWSYLGGTFTYE